MNPKLCSLIHISVYMCIYFKFVYMQCVFFIMTGFLQVSTTLSIQSKFHFHWGVNMKVFQSDWASICLLMDYLGAYLFEEEIVKLYCHFFNGLMGSYDVACVYVVRGSKNTLFSTYCTLLLLLYAPPFWNVPIFTKLIVLRSEVCSDWPAIQCVVIGRIPQACDRNVTPLTMLWYRVPVRRD